MPRRNNKKSGVPEFEQLNTSQVSHEQLGHHSTTRTSSQILARIAELRPVLPRPSQDGFNQGLGPVHLPSTGISHAHASRHPEHVFRPYERAYGMTHQHPGHFQSYLVPGPSNPNFGFNDQSQSFNGQMMGVPTGNSWSPRQEDVLDNSNFPSLCGCGDGCRCPGCQQHNRSSTLPPSYSSCSNPGACGACLDCTILSLPPSAIPPPDTALSIYDSQPDAIDDWLRQMLPSTSTDSFQNFPPNGAQFQQSPPQQSWGSRSFSYSDQQSDQQSNIDRNPRVQSPFAYGRSPPPPSMGFTSSSERSSDYPQRAHRAQSPMSIDGRPVIDPRLLPPNGMASYFGPPRSRSPSSSSQSSHQSSQDNQGSGSVPIYRPNERVQGIFPNVHGGVRTSPPQMNIRHLINRGPSSGSSSAPPLSGSSSSRRPPYTGNSGDNSGSNKPPLAGLHIY